MSKVALATFLTTLGITYLNYSEVNKINKELRFNNDGEFTIL